MSLYIIGLGLGDEKDITLKGLEKIQQCHDIYLESYTSILGVNKQKLEELYQKPVIEADRDTCEIGMDQILDQLAQKPDWVVAFLVVGDAFCATTHTDLFLRAKTLGIKVEVVHNASIVNAIGCTGMQVYRFGETISLPFFTDKWRPYSFYERIGQNIKCNLHTLVLLDIKVKERSEENILKDKKIFEPPRFMDTRVAAFQLLEAEQDLKQNFYNEDSLCIAVSRVGLESQKIVAGTLKQFLQIDMGEPLHSMVICAKELHPIEQEMFELYRQK